MRRILICGLLWWWWVGERGFADDRSERAVQTAPSGQAAIRGPAGASEIVITTTDRLAGAIHSLTWNGKQFIDSHDHGRQLQSAASFDCAMTGEFWAECYNPTEAGSRADGAGDTSSSKLLSFEAGSAELRSTTRMAFWLAPGEKSSGRPALNRAALSNHSVSKRVRIGCQDLPHVIEYEVTFRVPDGERHTHAQFEALTGYMPAEFSRFWRLSSSLRLESLTEGPGEQSDPVVLATEDGAHAMGVYSPGQPSPGFESVGYGRFRFDAEQVVKWNCVFRTSNARGIAPGEYAYRMFVAVGSLEDVRRSLAALIEK